VQSFVKELEPDAEMNELASMLLAASPAARQLNVQVHKPAIARSQASFSKQDSFANNRAQQVHMGDESKPLTVGNNLNLKGKVAFLCGASSEKGFGWAIAKELADAGATVIFGTWPMGLKIFERNYKKKSMEDERRLSDGSLMEVAKVYPLDAVYDTPEQVPEEIATNKRYKDLPGGFTIQQVVDQVKEDYGKIDILVHALANGPEVTKPLLETSREGYLEASSASAYSLVSMVSRFGPIMNPGGSVVSISYIASRYVIPGYGGGMSSAKAQLESDTRTLAYEAGRKWGIRVNTICAGCMASRAASAIGGDGDKPFIMKAIEYQEKNSPLTGKFVAEHVGKAALFLLTDMSAAVTGCTLPVDMGLHAMGLSLDSPCFE
jgi:enoyl-[acyl-carrier protein] reductase I